MIIIDTAFKLNVRSILSNAGFVLDNAERIYNIISHDTISRYQLEYREFHGRIAIRLSGSTIKNSRTIDYFEDDPKALNNLKSRLTRITKNEREYDELRVKRLASNLARKNKRAELVKEFNDRKGGHSIVIDQDSLEDDFSILTLFYRSYQFDVKMDEEGLLYTRQCLLNTASQDLSLDKVVALIDVLVDWLIIH